MKKVLIVLAFMSMCIVPLFATSNRIGVDGFVSFSSETRTFTISGTQTEEEWSDFSGGFLVNGAMYFGGGNWGVGYMAGIGKTISATKDEVEEDVSDYPLAWLVGATGNYGLSFNPRFSVEVGLGVLYELMSDEEQVGGTTLKTSMNTFSAVLQGSFFYEVAQNLLLSVGGMVTTPIYTTLEMSTGGVAIEADISMVGVSFVPKIGVSYAF